MERQVSRNDFNPTDHYHFALRYRYCHNKVSAFHHIFFQETYTAIHTVSGQSAPARHFWYAGSLLSEKCGHLIGQSRPSGTDCNPPCGRSSSLETADASVNCRRHSLLYAVGTICVLNSSVFLTFRTIHTASAAYDHTAKQIPADRTGFPCMTIYL